MDDNLNQLSGLVAQLPPDQVKRVVDFAMALHQQNSSQKPHGTDERPERAAVIAAMQYFDSLHPDDDWSDLLETPGEK